ncbi:MAG: VOC family protein [Betaproteobacteria bacterium]|nr:VOC family protein [Betaproteobacteria bacterium]
MSIRIAGLDHLVLRVRDLERMIGFYVDVLGAAVLWRRPDIGLVHLSVGSDLLDLVPVDGELGKKGGVAPGIEGRNLDHFCFRVEPFDQANIVRHLTEHGVTIGAIRERFGAEGTGISIYLADPENNMVELKGPSDGQRPDQKIPASSTT